MDRLIHFAEMIHTQYMTELILGILGCMVILMIINLAAIRRCRKQIVRLTEKSKDVMKIAMSQRAAGAGRNREEYIRKEPETNAKRGHAVTKSEEELFGSVIQEMFP